VDIFINDIKADIILEDEKTVGEVLSGLDKVINDNGQVLWALAVDGENASHNNMKEAFERKVEDIKHINIITVSIAAAVEAVKTTCAALKDDLDAAITRLENLSLDYQMGKDDRAAQTITLFTGMADQLLACVRALPHNTLKAFLPEPDAFYGEWNDLLRQFLDALTEHDTVSAGDLAEYEIAPRLRSLFDAVSAAAAVPGTDSALVEGTE
jgi:hypothetical protein